MGAKAGGPPATVWGWQVLELLCGAVLVVLCWFCRLLLASTKHRCCSFPWACSTSLPHVWLMGAGAGTVPHVPVLAQLHCGRCIAGFGSFPGTRTLSAASCGSERSQGMQTLPSAAKPQLIARES